MTMKRLFYSFIFVFLAIATYAGNDDGTVIQMTEQHGKKNHDEGIPVVKYSEDDNSLSVAFECDESCSLEVRTAEGEVTYSSPISTSGASNVYMLNLESESFYIITISSISETYTGILYTE